MGVWYLYLCIPVGIRNCELARVQEKKKRKTPHESRLSFLFLFSFFFPAPTRWKWERRETRGDILNRAITNFPNLNSPTNELVSKDKRFEVDGAEAAREFLRKEAPSWDKHRLQLVWDAIALHTTGSIVYHKEPEVVACAQGIVRHPCSFFKKKIGSSLENFDISILELLLVRSSTNNTPSLLSSGQISRAPITFQVAY